MKRSFLKLAAQGVVCALLAGSLPAGLLSVSAAEDSGQMALQAEEAVDGEEAPIEIQKLAIRSEEDLLTFAGNCMLADYSTYLEVHLEKDLNLSELSEGDFTGITSFSGVFYGEDHTISGLKLEGGSEAIGLFHYLENGAVVRDLNVVGTITSSQSQNMVGGIAGISAGKIQNCTFKGVITATGATGGIVGLNGANGLVSRCENLGVVNGIHDVGGIAGLNRGVISDCTNSASVNSDESWLELEDDSEVSLSPEGILYAAEEDWQNGTDIGGIAGFSNGIIAGCVNDDTVGYPHSGRNVGGIVGRQSGEVIRCINNGKVYGKQDVGGIVGQFEPKTSLEDVESLQKEVDELHDLMDQMIEDMDATSDDIHRDLDDLNGGASDAADTADQLMDEIRDVVKKNVNVLNELSSRVDYVIHHSSTVMTYVNQALNVTDDLIDDLDRVKQDLDIDEQMENQVYDEAAHRRLVLLDGVGGSLSTDNSNPAQDAQVTVSVKEDNGYKLEKLTMTPYGKSAVDVTASVNPNGKYSFAMPEENVTFAATFRYVGEYVAESNEGGRIALLVGTEDVKIRVLPEDDYEYVSLSVDGEDKTQALEKDPDAEIYTVTVDKKESSSPILVKGVFRRKAGSNPVHIFGSAGGVVISDMSAATPGTKVTLTENTLSGYKLDSLTMNNMDIMTAEHHTGEKEYQFDMPDDEADVKAQFRYTVSDGDAYVESNVGGTATAVAIPGTNDYRVTIAPDSEHELAETATVVTITDAAGSVKELTRADLTENANTYNYTLSINNYTTPVKVYVTFSERSEDIYSVTTTAGTGGTIAVNRTSAAVGDTLKIAVTNEAHYRLAKLAVNGVDVTAGVVDGVCDYTVPATVQSQVRITADFDPVLMVITSDEPGGKAGYAVSGDEVVLTLTQNTGFVPVEPLDIRDGDGTAILYQKQYADSYIYKFGVTDQMQQLQAATLVVAYTRQMDKEAVEEAKDGIERQSDSLSSSVDNMSSTAERMEDILRDEYGEVRDPEELSDDELEELSDYLLDMAGYLTDASVAAGGVLSDAVTIQRITSPYLEDAQDNVGEDLDKLSEDARTMSDALQNAGSELQSIVDYLDALNKLEAVNLSSNFDKNADLLTEQMNSISDILRRMNSNLDIHSEKLEEDMRAVNDQMNVVFDLMVEKIDNLENMANGKDIMEDHSAEDPASENASRVSYSNNNGSVKGDRNVGGIAGNMAVEGTDSQDQTGFIGNKYITRAVLQSCDNKGVVTVRNENAGGIVGLMEVGYTVDCVGSGKIGSESGSCIGGIAGLSKATIDQCSSLAVLSGGEYIGGIAGKGNKVSNCYSMASILDAEGFVGAIAGVEEDADEEEEDITIRRQNVRDRFRDNYYVSSSLQGINGVSYVGVAEPVTYEELLEMQEAPLEFRHLEAVFIDADDNVVKRMAVRYGENLEQLEYPVMTTEDGDYIEWEGVEGERVEGNMVIQAVTTSNVTILASEEKVASKSIALAEGVFTEAATITVESLALDSEDGGIPEDAPVGSICHTYRITLNRTGLGEEDVTRLRLLNEEGTDAAIYCKTVEGWQRIASKAAGSYNEVQMTGTEGVFCVASYEKERPVWMYVSIAGCVVVILVLSYVILRMRKKMSRREERESENRRG